MPLGYSNYYKTYNPTGTYAPSNYLQGYNNPYFYDPQGELDLAIANHAYQKSLPIIITGTMGLTVRDGYMKKL